MRKSVIALCTIGLMAAAIAPAMAGNPTTGAGAQKASLFERPSSSSCAEQTTGNVAGFVILNSTGQPGSSKSVLGEVSVKTEPNQTYMVELVNGNGGNSCADMRGVGMLSTNDQGKGNAHIDQLPPFGSAGTYHVVLHNMTPTGSNGKDLASPNVPLD